MGFTIVINKGKNNKSEIRQKQERAGPSRTEQDAAACRLSATGCCFLGVRLATSHFWIAEEAAR